MASVSMRLLFVWILCVIAGTLAPFDFATMPAGIRAFQYGSYERSPADFALNLLMLVPLGALLHHEGRKRFLTLRSIVILAGGASVLLSGALEYVQTFLPSRNSSLIDVVANTGGAMMGVAAGRVWGSRVETCANLLRARTSPARLGGLIAGFLVVALLISGALQARTRLSNWSSDYPLLVGNERTGGSPWRGRVFALTITDAPTSLASVRRFSAGASIALPGSQIAAFDFTEGPPYKDIVGNLPNLDWTTGADASAGTGVTLLGRSWLQSEGPASGLAHRLRETNAFTLRILCATDDTDPKDGTARIVSNSVNAGRRNFTLGQQGRDLVFRLRTPATGVDAYPFEVHVPGAFSNRGTRDILVTYDGATILMAMANSDHISRAELTPGSSVALAIPSLYVQSDELPFYKLGYVAGVSLVPGVLVGLLGHTRRHRLAFGVGWVLAFSILFEATVVQASERAFDWGNVAFTAAVSAAVLMVLGATLSQAAPLNQSARAWQWAGSDVRAES